MQEHEATLRHLIAEVVDDWRKSGPPTPVTPDFQNTDPAAQLDVLGVGRGWTSHVVRTGQLIETINLERFSILAAPLTRSMLEHVVGIAWLCEQRDTAVSVLRQVQYQERAKAREAQRLGWEHPAESEAWLNLVQPQLDSVAKEALTYAKVKHQSELTRHGRAYQMWQAETSYSHARLETAGIHIHLETSENRYRDHKLAETPNGRLYVTAELMVDAVYEYHRLLGDGAFEPELHHWLDLLESTRAGVNEEIRTEFK